MEYYRTVGVDTFECLQSFLEWRYLVRSGRKSLLLGQWEWWEQDWVGVDSAMVEWDYGQGRRSQS